jgi:DNA invertase Pin-like site-specific DNA recombinase
MEGIAKAKSNGVKFGRQAALTPTQLGHMRAKRESGVLIKDLMAEFSLSKASVYRLLQSEKSQHEASLSDAK